jgi:hypothetical protein
MAGALNPVAVEYYHALLDHYFMTAAADEIAALDQGSIPGWTRTGQSFSVLATGDARSGSSPVCRFYGRPEAGLNSHFYSASPAECAAVQAQFGQAWQLEAAEVFRAFLPNPATGACEAGQVPIYRSFNNRSDANHRYTANASVQAAMLRAGYVAEGYGQTPVIFCGPGDGAPVVPVCTLTSSANTPAVGTTIQLTASCSNQPTSYSWLGCVGNGNVCTVTSASAGALTYSVTARNAAGSSNPANITVNWQGSSGGIWSGSCPGFSTTLALPLVWSSTQGNVSALTRSKGDFTDGAVVAYFTTPAATADDRLGRITIAEYGGAPAYKTATLSRQPCDFGPGIATAESVTATIYFVVGNSAAGYPQLLPGTTYYFNVANRQNGAPSCTSDNCDSRIELAKPRGL